MLNNSWLNEVYTYLIMSPAEHDIVQPTARFVHAIFSRVDRVSVVWVRSEGTRVDNSIRKGASNYERIL